ncbi:hypothetical protein FBU30_007508 [Linnemannia zychae]|nr:hypothetical protein FBU30_007508 [Linnemannia zychae]
MNFNTTSSSGSAFGSAFGGHGMSFGGGASNNNNNNVNNPSGSAFNSSTTGNNSFNVVNNGGSPSSAFGNFGAGNSSAFISGGGFNTFNNNPTPDQSQYGGYNNHSDGSRGRGRGRGNSSYRGGRGGGNRGGANMTYVAPGLSNNYDQQPQQQHQQHQSYQPHTKSHLSTVFNAGSSSGDESNSAFTSTGSNRGRGGHSGGPRGRGRGGSGVPGQFRSIQWRPDSQGADTSMTMDSISETTNGGSFTAFSTGSAGGSSAFQQQTGPSAFSSNNQGSAFGGANQSSVFGGTSQGSAFGGTNQTPGFTQSSGAGFHSPSSNRQWTPSAPSASSSSSSTSISAFQKNSSGISFGIDTASPSLGSSTTSAFSSNIPAAQGLSTSAFRKEAQGKNTPTTQSDSAFSISTPRSSATSSPLRSSQSVFIPANKSPLSSDVQTSKHESHIADDAESRMTRFSAVPIGNRFEELKESRVKEREEAIRRGDIPDPSKPRRLEDAIAFVGTCTDMCPEFERHEREYQQNIEKFEKIPGTESVDHARAVKAYARPAAGAEQPLPSDVRPPKVLLSTLKYLMNEVVGKGDLADSHAFVRDRTRSIRQDFTLQNSRGMEAIQAHETIARYHILCMHQLCENKSFSEQQEMEQLRKVLTSLQEFYDDMRLEGIPCPNEAEFRAYHILSHLRDPDMIRQAQQLPLHIFQDPYIQVAAEIHALTRRNNDLRRRAKIQSEASPNFFSRFFKLIAGPSTTYLMACLLETNFVEIRKGALKALNKSYLEQHAGFPLEDLVKILGCDDAEECITNCEEYDLSVRHQDGSAAVIFGRRDENRRRIFKEPTLALKQHRNERIVEVKRQDFSTEQIIYGQLPKPQALGTFSNVLQPIALPTARSLISKPAQGLTSASAALRQNSFIPTAPGSSTSTAPFSAATITKPAMDIKSNGPFDFGLGGTTSLKLNGLSSATQGSLLPSAFSATAGVGLGAAVTTASLFNQGPSSALDSSTAFPTSCHPSTNLSTTAIKQSVSLFPNTSAAKFKPSAFNFSSTQNNVPSSNPFALPLAASTPSTGTPIQSSTFAFKAPEMKTPASASPLNFNTSSQTPPSNGAPFTLTPTMGDNTATRPKPPSAISTTSTPPGTSVQPPTPTRSSLFATPPPPLSPSLAPKSDATRIVTKRGRIYPRSIVDAVAKELLDLETDRLVRMMAAQVSQEIAVERSIRRAKERQETIQRESMRILADIMTQVANETTEDILAEIFRETNVQRRVIARWKAFTVKSIQRAEELRRRQEHFLTNVRAMGSRAGLMDAEPWMTKIRNQNTTRRSVRAIKGTGQPESDIQAVKAMVASNKRKRLLSIGQEGSPDLALVAGLKKAAAPKQEMWAPVPVLETVQNQYDKARAVTADDSTVQNRRPGGLTKRRWRLFVATASFKETTSKWLLRKLGVDMSRTTKAQQRLGTIVAEHVGKTDSKNALDVIVHGTEDASVMELLGMSKYEIMETGAFMFEFSKIPIADHEATEQVISPEVWERMSPRMVEYLELDAMVKSPKAPILSYRFLNMDMSMMKLDRFVTGSLEWLATETKDYFEDPAAILTTLIDKYRPIFEWALCRISLAEAPRYSQYDEEDEEEANMWLLKQKQWKKQLEQMLSADIIGTNGVGNGGQIGIKDTQPPKAPKNLFIDSVESGFNLAVQLFNWELEYIAQTIETKGQGETREGAVQEGRVKDAIARFIRQAELPEMKPGSIRDRIYFGMDSKSAFCDFMDAYLVSLGGLAKEPQNQDAKATMRTEIWKMLRSIEDRVPLEAIFKCISEQVLLWIEAGILDTDRFNIRLKKLESQRNALEHQQNQYQQQRLDKGDKDDETKDDKQKGQTKNDLSEIVFTPLLIHDEVDIEVNVFDFDTTAQSEVRIWERAVEKQVREREERGLAVPAETSSFGYAGLTTPYLNSLGADRFGDSRKRLAPENPRETLKKSRIQARSGADLDDENLFLVPKTAIQHVPYINGASLR